MVVDLLWTPRGSVERPGLTLIDEGAVDPLVFDQKEANDQKKRGDKPAHGHVRILEHGGIDLQRVDSLLGQGFLDR